MAVPDEEYALLWHRLLQRPHSNRCVIYAKDNKERMTFWRTRNEKVKCVRTIEGKEIKFEVLPLSKAMGGDERTFLKSKLKEKYPDYNDARLNVEVDMIYEMRESVKKIVEQTGCKPEEALRALEMGLASKEAELMMKDADKELTLHPTGSSSQPPSEA